MVDLDVVLVGFGIVVVSFGVVIVNFDVIKVGLNVIVVGFAVVTGITSLLFSIGLAMSNEDKSSLVTSNMVYKTLYYY